MYRFVSPLACLLISAGVFLGSHSTAEAAVRMDFEGLSPLTADGRRDNVLVGTFYNGGSSLSLTDGSAVAAGVLPSMGVTFSSGAVVGETALGGNGGSLDVFGPARNLLLADGTAVLNSTALGTGVVFGGASSFIDISFAEGFTTGLSFFFNALSSLNVSLLRQDGTVLASADFRLPGTSLCPSGQSRCEWNAATLAFEGTAYGVRFSGPVGDFALDNITLGQLDPLGALVPGGGGGGGGGGNPVTPIPEPSTYALMAFGLGWVIWTTRRQRARVSR